MQVFIYMALVAKDKDEEPWFGMGHDALAQLALRRPPGRPGVKAVERAIGPLFDEGAITVVRRAAQRSTGPNTVKYRLHLDAPAENRQKRRNFPRKPGEVSPAEPRRKITHFPRKPALTSPGF